MQEVIQAAADKIADLHGIAHVQVQRFGLLPEERRMEYMRHEMAHHIHAAHIKAAGVKGAGDNAHGRNWRNIAAQVGCQPKDDNCPMKRQARRMGNAALAQAIIARSNAHVVVAAPVVQAPRFVENPQTRAEWVQYIAAKGLVKLGNGASRTAYALNATQIIKISTNEHDHWNQCEGEAKRWEMSTSEQRQYLATIYKHGKGWIVMERAQFVLRTCDENTQHAVCHDMQVETRIGDLHSANIGYFGKGRFKILDYAL